MSLWARAARHHPETEWTKFIGPVHLLYNTRRLKIYRGFTVLYAEKGGRMVLRGERSWTKVNGFMLNTPKGHFIFQFRRVSGIFRK